MMRAIAAPRIAFLVVTALLVFNSYALSTGKSGEPIQFTYYGAKGRDRWGSLDHKFMLCKNGKSQSPINILKSKVVLNKRLKPLIRSYDSANATLVNNKFAVVLHYADHSGGLIVDGKMYKLKQIHWHTPAEHRIDGRYLLYIMQLFLFKYAAEFHQVHVAKDGNVSVVAILFKYGNPDPVVSKVNFRTKIDAKPKKYKQVRSISREQVEALKAPLDTRCKSNARPWQPMNGRKVELYEDETFC